MTHAENMANLQLTVDRLVREAQRAVQAESSWRPAWEQWQQWLSTTCPCSPGVVVGVAYGGQLLHHATHGHVVLGVDPYEPYDAEDETSVSAVEMDIRYQFVRARLVDSPLVDVVRDRFCAEHLTCRWNWVFIDGCHQYDAVVHDIRAALSVMDPAVDLIGGHDYLSGWTGVTRAVDECCPPGFRVEAGNACCWRYVRA